MTLRNRPAPPTYAEPGNAWSSVFDCYDWMSGDGIVADESFHGMQEHPITALSENVLQRTGEGVLYFAGVACKNNSGSSTYDFDYAIVIDGNTVVIDSGLSVPPGEQAGICIVGQTILNVAGTQLVVADFDYWPYESSILFQVQVSNITSMDAIAIYEHIIT